MGQKKLSLQEVANLVRGELVNLSSEIEVSGISSLDKAGETELSFLSDKRYKNKASESKALALLVDKSNASGMGDRAHVIVKDPYGAAIILAESFLVKSEFKPGVHATAIVDETAEVDSSASIGPYCIVGKNVKVGAGSVIESGVKVEDDVTIGSATHVHSNAVIYRESVIGSNCIIKASAVIGGVGFGYTQDNNGNSKQVPHLGKVLIGDDVHIGSSSTIDRGSFDDTVIQNGVKIDNQVQIGHNVRIGTNTVIAGCSAIAGSTHIGSFCMLGGGARISDHLTFTDGVMLSGNSVVGKSIEQPGVYANGFFGLESYRDWAKKVVLFKNINKMDRRLKDLEKKCNE